MNQTDIERLQLDHFQRWSLMVGIGGLALSVIGLFFNSAQFFQSYLFGYIFWVQLALGCMTIVMIHHLAGGRWSFIIRRTLEAGMMTLPLLALLFVPLLFGMSSLYEWARPEAVAQDQLLQHKAVYLNVPFFIIRTVVYFVLWIGMAYLLRRWSIKQDETSSLAIAYRTKLFSGPALAILSLAITFASFDWMMSLEPHWFSTIYGMMFGVGMLAAGFSGAVLCLAWLVKYSSLSEVVTPKHINDLANFLLASVMLWAYIALSQYLIIWSGNLPEETPWYVHRSQGGWQVITVILVVFHFAAPFLILLSRSVKRQLRIVVGVAALIILMRALDLFWLITPAFHPTGFYLHWLHVTTFVGLGGLWGAAFIWFLKKQPLLPQYDIRIEKEKTIKHDRKEAQSY
jgi:hypothetical protein